MSLPRYNLEARCEKCGVWDEHHTQWMQKWHGDPEALLRECKNCGYQWKEACVE